MTAKAASVLPFSGPTVANTTVTNVPGPPEPIFFSGARLVRAAGLGPLIGGLNLIHVVASYNGTLSISATADRDARRTRRRMQSAWKRRFSSCSPALAEPVELSRCPPDRTKRHVACVTVVRGLSPRACQVRAQRRRPGPRSQGRQATRGWLQQFLTPSPPRQRTARQPPPPALNRFHDATPTRVSLLRTGCVLRVIGRSSRRRSDNWRR